VKGEGRERVRWAEKAKERRDETNRGFGSLAEERERRSDHVKKRERSVGTH